MNDLQTQIINLIRQAPDQTVGVTFDDLVVSLEGFAEEHQVKEGLKFLQDEGTVFTTKDEHHFAVTDS